MAMLGIRSESSMVQANMIVMILAEGIPEMSEDKQSSPSLHRGSMLGKQTVRHFVSSDPVGDRYAVVFGSTNRLYDVNISWGPDARFSLSDFEELLARTSSLRHPCLIPYFACGEDQGIAWVRSEHSEGAPDWVTTSVESASGRHTGDKSADDENEVYFTTLRSLLDATNGRISNKDRNLIIGDIAEAVAYLQVNGLHAGTISPETVFLDKTFRHSNLIARLRFYAWPEATTPVRLSDDVHQAGELLLLLLAASDKTKGTKLYKALSDLALLMGTPGTIATGKEFYDEICAIFEENGEFHKPRTEKRQVAYAADGSVLEPLAISKTVQVPVAGSSRRHRSDHHRHRKNSQAKRKFDSNSATGQMLSAALRIGVMFASIVGVGLAVFFGMKHLDNRRRAKTLITSAQRYSAISIIEDESEKVDMSAFPENVLDYTPEQLKTASGQGDAIATARLAILALEENPADPGLKIEADAILAPSMSRLEIVAMTDPVAAYWYGYVRLLGINSEPDADEAVMHLRRAIDNGYADARILLGDWLANRKPGGNVEDDRQAVQQWREAFGNPTKWTNTQLDAINRIIAFVRQKRGVKDDDVQLAKLLTHAATAGHLDAMMLASELHDSGRIVERSSSTALSWLRRITSNASTPDTLRAEAQRRMAEMFAAGRGTPASLSAARIWYERAAKLGNKAAMLTLAEFCENGKGQENGKRDYDVARYWRDKATSVAPPPPTERLFRLLPSSFDRSLANPTAKPAVESPVEASEQPTTISETAPKDEEIQPLD